MHSTGIGRSDVCRLWTCKVWDGGEHITADYLWPQQKDELLANTTVIPAPNHNRSPVSCDLMHVFLQRNANIWDSNTGQWECYSAGLEFFSMQSYSGGCCWHISTAWDQEKPQDIRRHVMSVQCLIINHSKHCIKTDRLLFTALLIPFQTFVSPLKAAY